MRMHGTCMMGRNLLYLFLLSTGILAVLPTVTSTTEIYTTNSSSSKKVDFKEILPRKDKPEKNLNKNDWICPHVTDISEISCSCSLPHTVRCRGSAKFPEVILRVTHELSQVNESEQVSLLDLAIHNLGKLPPASFKGLPLLGLVISKAGLHTVDKESFVGIESTLGALGLPSNELISVPADAIKFLRQLHRLDLSDNSLNVLNSHEFPTLLQIHNVNLAGNKMRLIEDEAFARLPQLRSLNLARNQLDISQINERTLWGLHFLQQLSLESNLIKGALSPLFLQSAPELITLDLSHNAITKITFGALRSLVNLKHLDLSHNTIDIIEDHSFKHLGSLEHLDISHNNIVAVSGSSLSHLPLLESLNMADNSLFAVTADLLHQLPNLTMIDLAANDISLLQPDVFNYTPKLMDLGLADNPLHCDCSLTWFLNWLRTHVRLTDEHKRSVVCATPPQTENAPLVDLDETELLCNKDVPDYYLDASTDYEDHYELRISDAEVSLLAASWMEAEVDRGSSSSPAGVQLVWRVDQRAVPYTCQAVHIYERETIKGNVHEILAEKVSVNCSSEGQVNPNRIVVTVPAKTLKEGAVYRYCLVLIEKGTSDKEGVLPGCSEALILKPPPEDEAELIHRSAIASLTAGQMSDSLIVQTRVAPVHKLCKYIVAVVNKSRVAQIRVVNCTDVRLTFSSLSPSNYIVCGSLISQNPVILNNSLVTSKSTYNFYNLSTEDLQELITNSGNSSAEFMHTAFDSCATVKFTDTANSWNTAPLFTLLFTIPGIAFLITLYLIGRRIWKGGGVPWKWDPRDQKSAKYFLYTGEAETPCQSVDHLDMSLPESTTPV